LGLTKIATQKEIKKSYYKLSFEHHPDKGGDPILFGEMTEAYDVLMDDFTKKEYDSKSIWGLNYDESLEFLEYEFNNNAKVYDEKSYEDFKKSKSFKGDICFYEYYYLKALMYNNYIFKDCDSLSSTIENYKSIINMKTDDILLEQMFPLCIKQSNFSYIYHK
jgi:curved DNA-binding protein CbpA